MKPALAWPAGILAAALALRLLLFSGIQGNDDRYYSAAALRLARGEVSAGPELLGTRVAYVAPVAVLYGLFGVKEACLVAPNLAASLVLTLLAYQFGLLLFSVPIARVAGAFVALLPLDVFYATESHTDLPLAMFLGLGAYGVCRAATDGGRIRRITTALLAGLAFGGAHLTKESGLFLIAPLLPLLLRRERRVALGIALGVAAAVVGIECLMYGAGTGDPLYRIHLAHASQTGPGAASAGFLSRLLALPSFSLNPLDAHFPYSGGLMALAAAGCGCAGVRDWKRSSGVAAWWLFSGLLLAVFPLSLFPFRPALELQPRMFAVLALPGSLLAGVFLVEVIGTGRQRAAWGIGVLGGALALLCAVRIHADGVRWRAGAVWALPELAGRPEARVITDPRTAEMLRMFSGYRPDFILRGYEGSDPPPPPGTLLLDFPRQAGAARLWDGVEAPAWWKTSTPPRRTVAELRMPAPLRLRGPRGPEERTVLVEILPGP